MACFALALGKRRPRIGPGGAAVRGRNTRSIEGDESIMSAVRAFAPFASRAASFTGMKRSGAVAWVRGPHAGSAGMRGADQSMMRCMIVFIMLAGCTPLELQGGMVDPEALIERPQ